MGCGKFTKHGETRAQPPSATHTQTSQIDVSVSRTHTRGLGMPSSWHPHHGPRTNCVCVSDPHSYCTSAALRSSLNLNCQIFGWFGLCCAKTEQQIMPYRTSYLNVGTNVWVPLFYLLFFFFAASAAANHPIMCATAHKKWPATDVPFFHFLAEPNVWHNAMKRNTKTPNPWKWRNRTKQKRRKKSKGKH